MKIVSQKQCCCVKGLFHINATAFSGGLGLRLVGFDEGNQFRQVQNFLVAREALFKAFHASFIAAGNKNSERVLGCANDSLQMFNIFNAALLVQEVGQDLH